MVEHVPLSWKQARERLRGFLEEYMDTSPTPIIKKAYDDTPARSSSIVNLLLEWDLDLYGSILASTAILLIAALAYSDEAISIGNNGDVNSRVHRSELAGAILLLMGCLFNIWVVARRRYSSSRGTDSLKRREIAKFLKALDRLDEDTAEDPSGTPTEDTIDLVGTSLTDIFPVFRVREVTNGNKSRGSWARIPTLLLVEGDFVALQVGDLAPATCISVGISSAVKIDGGERLTLETFGETAESVLETLPKGRTTLPNESDALMKLCNHTQIFKLLESPLKGFLVEPRVEQRKPQVWRQLEAIRTALFLVAGVVLFMSVLPLFLRPASSSDDLPFRLTLPFMAALGALPLTGAACSVFTEIIGTSRILVSYHPVASLRHDMRIETQGQLDRLLLRYVLATVSNRLSLQRTTRRMRRAWNSVCKLFTTPDKVHQDFGASDLVRVPPASLNLLEKLGVATAFTLVDDELACDPHAIPQQLLVPSGKGLKLLDICRTYEDDTESDTTTEHRSGTKAHDEEDNLSDSDSDEGLLHHHHLPSGKRRLKMLKKQYQKGLLDNISAMGNDPDEDAQDVQFEDPQWWQHLPSLKCIGLACLLLEEKKEHSRNVVNFEENLTEAQRIDEYRKSLVRLICTERKTCQLRSLAKCIGFSADKNAYGDRGDLSSFTEKFRLQVVTNGSFTDKIKVDSHERGSEESRWWGLLRPDATSLIVHDSRSGGYQLLTVGDPRAVTRMCQEAWQGENSTILPLSGSDRRTLLETSNEWKLADLDVEAFSYSPVPQTFEKRVDIASPDSKQFYLFDNDPKVDAILPNMKDKSSTGEWPLVHNQIFLGILGSLVTPQEEIQGLLSVLQDAGVRFVYFSPRNMRRQKEIASQMGIDVAWNCAISLRPLSEGEQEDRHRMKSEYADWDVNAKLPHGIESVKEHLKEVDNVPLLVSLFTDVTKESTAEMIEVFQEYQDTVIAVGLSHLPRNSKIFSSADLSVGVDILTECIPSNMPDRPNRNTILPSEIAFVSAISSHQCAFRVKGISATAYLPTIIAQGRASLEAATSATMYMVSGCLSFSFYVLFCTFTVGTVVPFVPLIGSVMILQVILPIVGLTIAMGDLAPGSMKRVPPKNDQSVVFGRKEGKAIYQTALLKALPPAALPQLLYLIIFGEFIIEMEPDLATACSESIGKGDWTQIVRCEGLKDYTGPARISAGALSLAELALCVVVASAAFVYRTEPMLENSPFRRNHIWCYSLVVSVFIIGGFVGASLEPGLFWSLPWYYYIMAVFLPFLCLAWDEFWKRTERSHYNRAEKLRRLQFETRLGMWSPK